MRSSATIGQLHRKRCGPWLPAEPVVEDVNDRSAGQPVVEIPEHDEERVPHRIEILRRSADLKPAFADPQPQMRGQHMDQLPRTFSVAAIAPRGSRRSIDRSMRWTSTMGWRVKSALPKHCVTVLPRVGPSAHVIAIQRRQDDRAPRFERDAGGVGELLQRDDVGVQFGDHRGDAIRVVASVGADTRVHVVGGHPNRRTGS